MPLDSSQLMQGVAAASPTNFGSTGALANPAALAATPLSGANVMAGNLGPGATQGFMAGQQNDMMQQQFQTLQQQQATEQQMREFQLDQARKQEASSGEAGRAAHLADLKQHLELMPDLTEALRSKLHSDMSSDELNQYQNKLISAQHANDAISGLDLAAGDGATMPLDVGDQIRKQYKTATGMDLPEDSAEARAELRSHGKVANDSAPRLAEARAQVRALEMEKLKLTGPQKVAETEVAGRAGTTGQVVAGEAARQQTALEGNPAYQEMKLKEKFNNDPSSLNPRELSMLTSNEKAARAKDIATSPLAKILGIMKLDPTTGASAQKMLNGEYGDYYERLQTANRGQKQAPETKNQTATAAGTPAYEAAMTAALKANPGSTRAQIEAALQAKQ